MNSKKVFKIVPGVNFTTISDSFGGKKFKKNLFSLNFFVPLDNKTVAANALLTKILVNSCKKYPDFIEFNKRLAELYGASISSGVEKIGETQVLSFYAEFIDDRFAFDNIKISEEICELLCNVIFDPNITNGKFDANVFDQEKRQLIEQIDAEFNDKQVYASRRCIEEMCRGEKFGISKFGEKKCVKNLKNEDVCKAWKNLLEQARVEIFLIGNSSSSNFVETLHKKFNRVDRKNIFKCSAEIVSKVKEIHEVTEKMSVLQSKLVMGFRVGIAEPDSNTAAAHMMAMVLGGTPNSKLFLNVREKKSLCYYCSAVYDKVKGILMISSGVDHDNILEAKVEILNQLEAMKNGNITEDEIFQIKNFVMQAISGIHDNIFRIEDFEMIRKVIGKEETVEEYAQKIQNVTKEDIVKAARQVILDTTYVLTEGSNE